MARIFVALVFVLNMAYWVWVQLIPEPDQMTGFLLDINTSELWDSKPAMTKEDKEENSTEKQIKELRRKNSTLEWQVNAGKYYRNLTTRLGHMKTASIFLILLNSAIMLGTVILLSLWKGDESENNNENTANNLSAGKDKM